MLGRGLSARERRTVAAGAVVSALALFASLVAVPLGNRWSERERLIDAKAEQLARLRALLDDESRLDAAATAREQGLTLAPQRLLSGRTPAVAASALQALIQGFADESRVTVNSLDVAGAPDTTAAALPAIPATLSAVGDIYGMTALLDRLQHGPRLLEIQDMTLMVNPSLRGSTEVLQLNATIRAPYVSREE